MKAAFPLVLVGSGTAGHPHSATTGSGVTAAPSSGVTAAFWAAPSSGANPGISVAPRSSDVSRVVAAPDGVAAGGGAGEDWAWTQRLPVPRSRPGRGAGLPLAGGICGLVLAAGVGGEGLRPACAWPWLPLSAPTQRPALPDALGALAAAPSRAPAAKPSAGATPASGSRLSRDFPVGTLLKSQPLATAAGGLLLALLLADRLVLWMRPLWLLRFPDESLDLPIGDGNVLPLGSRLFRVLKYRPRVLDAWVEEHQGRIKQRFAALSTVKERRHHLGLPVLVGETTLVPMLTSELLRPLDGDAGCW